MLVSSQPLVLCRGLQCGLHFACGVGGGQGVLLATCAPACTTQPPGSFLHLQMLVCLAQHKLVHPSLSALVPEVCH